MLPGGKMKKHLLAAAFLLLLPAFARAEMMYITDRIEASVRSGKGLAAGSKYLDVVRTGDKVEVLATDGEYAQIRMEKGTEGWLHTRYLTATPPKSAGPNAGQADTTLQKASSKNDQDELTKLREEKTELETLRNQQAVKIRETEAALEELKSGRTDFTKMRAEIEKVRQELESNKALNAQLAKENEDLSQNMQLMWFIFGAAAVLCGFIIGMWLQSLRSRRRPKISF
jgi:SH3 domain protein